MKNLIAVIVASLTLSGCGVNYDVGPDMANLANVQAAAESKCMEAWAKSQKIDCTGMTEMACVVAHMQQQNVQLFAAATGNPANPCFGRDNLFTVMKEEVVQKNQTLRELGGDAFGAVKWISGAIAVEKVADTIGKNARNVNNVDTAGGDASISNSTSITEMNTDATTSNVGDGTANTNTPEPAVTVDTIPTTTDATVDTATVTE